jgi:hypothetical protein
MTTNIKWAIKYILPILAIFFTYGFLGNLYTITLTKNDLIKNTGVIQNIETKLEQSGRNNKYYPLIINLGFDNFRLIDSFKDNYDSIKSMIFVGDSVTIYSRSTILTYLGMGQKNDIYCIDKNGFEIFKFQDMISYKRNQMIIFLIISLFLWSSFFYSRNRIITK